MAISLTLGAVFLAALTGCVGYVEGGHGAVIVPEPDVYIFGGPYEGRGYVHGYSERGHESRGWGRGHR